MPRYDLTLVLTYYTPYVSGLSEAARMVAEGMAARGWRVAVATTQHDRALPERETIAAVDVYRAPVVGRLSRTTVSPGFPRLARRLARDSAVLHLHLPMLEAAMVARRAGNTPIVSTLHIDLYLPPGPLSTIAMRASDHTSRMAVRRSTIVVTNSEDQARGSRLWPELCRRTLVPIPAPCRERQGGSPTYRHTSGPHIGFLGRIVEDKGIGYLLEAFRGLPNPSARLLLGGNYTTVAGGSSLDRLRAAIDADPRVVLLGELSGRQVDDFYASIDVFALPSIAESFGIAQVEAMMAGVPSVTTDLPGGRYPVLVTGFGQVVPPRDPVALRRAIVGLLDSPAGWRLERAANVRARFSARAALDAYERAFTSARRHNSSVVAGQPLGGDPYRQR